MYVTLQIREQKVTGLLLVHQGNIKNRDSGGKAGAIFNKASKNMVSFNLLISIISSLHKIHKCSFHLNAIAILSVEQILPLEQERVCIDSVHTEL